MSGTSVRYTGHARSSVEVMQDGRVIAEMAVAKFCEIDGALHDTAARAMQCIGEAIAVPNYGKVQRPRNSRVHGICQ